MARLIAKIMAVFFSVLQFFGIQTGGNTTDSWEKYTDITYGDGTYQVMDVYVPDSAEKRSDNGAFLFIHGGAWTTGDKTDMEVSGYLSLLDEGYILVFMDYTLYLPTDFGKTTADSLSAEVDMAVSCLKNFSDEHSLHITKLCTSGVSAGGHISLMYTYKYLKDHQIAIPVVFTANQVAPCDFSYDIWSAVYDDATIVTTFSGLAGRLLTLSEFQSGAANDILRTISPVYYMDSATVPSIAGYGLKDTLVPTGNASSMKAALASSGIDYAFIEYPNSNHLLQSDPEVTELFNATRLEFARKYFGY